MGFASFLIRRKITSPARSRGSGVMSICYSCITQTHLLCYFPDDDGKCCCPELLSEIGSTGNKRGGPVKDLDDITDIESTGRKRAAVAFPITEGMPCEWRGLKNAGGGAKPITGCINGDATDRHHGPDKNTLNNSEGNVHRICSHCHNRWHTENDLLYPSERPPASVPFIPLSGEVIPHDSVTKATEEEVYANELSWFQRGKLRKVRD